MATTLVWHPTYAATHPSRVDSDEDLHAALASGWFLTREDMLNSKSTEEAPADEEEDADDTEDADPVDVMLREETGKKPKKPARKSHK